VSGFNIDPLILKIIPKPGRHALNIVPEEVKKNSDKRIQKLLFQFAQCLWFCSADRHTMFFSRLGL